MQQTTVAPPVLFCGCGWLGRHYVALTDNTNVVGTTRSAEKASALNALGVNAVRFTLGESPEKLKHHLSQRSVVLNIPPGRKHPMDPNFASNIITLAKTLLAANIPRLIFISTTSVYGNQTGVLNEQTPTAPNTPSGEHHCAIEQALLALADPRITIIRLAGLVGPDRHPVNFLSGRKLDKGEQAVNLVHVKDVVKALHLLLQKPINDLLPPLLHLCSLAHPRRDEYYTWAAKQRERMLPVFTASSSSGVFGKQINAQRSWQALGLTPTFVSPYDMV
ncbi:NAD-dependent epimerase/dehydratase family protein [Alteromonas sp. C1M14]|uniref:NAD-dependent epimerase/dehydratase family protein n=1 Tax=Alteromonas sp. C1M14 TaxID=2841567 RepID=UPI001C09A4F0|nr:NAD-dependent epimerase/dehydratase family protein [Alteromonas sp. C1M14]MBU2976630.1 NAD-dependent epimerase/dehydratase family protein [Alteromonas sp. C1M14]